ncbi:hypothetical protein BKA69DRAFT_592062 [Paraphysoderma sedebokerense]|nr:hypothetical protein BKA69DRAFT_592062 [Paraphysoderma sedebokerense]
MPYNTTTYEDQFITIELTATDPDVGDTIQLFIVSMPSNGTLYQVTSTDTKGALVNTTFGRVALTNSQNKIMYTPDQDFFGIDSFNFIAQDSQNADSLTQTATITLLPLDDPPKVQNMVVMLDEDTNTSFVLPVVDPDTPGLTSSIQLTILSLPSKGNLYIQNTANQTFDLIEAIPYVLEANDGTSDSIINATVTLVVNPVNDAPIFNTTLVQNLTVYEDTDVIIPLDITDVDISDTLVVKITNIRLNGTLFRVDRSTGSRTSQTVGEGSEIPGPPYQLYFVPARNYYTRSSDLDQRFNVTYSDGKVTFSKSIEFAVLPVNDPPSLVCTSNVLLPSDVLVGISSFHFIQLQASDVDDLNLEYHLLAAPEKGYLNASVPLTSGSIFTTTNLTFYPNDTGGAYPYGNFTVFAKDKNGGISNHCTFSFRFSCPPAKYNNIYSNGTGPICAACLDGADCSQDGSIPPRPRYGYWQSSISTFLPCFPAEACTGGENRCATGYSGDRCGSCANKYYRLNNACNPCPDDRTTRIVVIVICLLIGTLMMFGVMRLVGKGPNYGLANILINFIQYILILRELRLNWPPEFHIILNAISFINFNIELTSPECLLETDLNYGMKMKLTLAIPIVLAADLFLFRLIGVMYSNIKKCFGQPAGSLVIRKSNDPKKTSAFLVAVRVYNSLLSIVFATVTTKALGLFDCTLEDDGFYYLDADNSVKCYTDDWYKEVPYAIAGIMVYVVGIPLYFSIMLYLLYQKKNDGLKWKNAKKVVSNVMDYDRIYKEEQQTFVVVQLFQKLSLIVISMFFTRHTGLQVVLTQTVLLISLMLYLKYKPYNYPILNILEISSAVCSVLVLGLGLPFHVDRAKISGQTGLIIAMLFLIFAFIFAVICASVYEIQSKVRERVKSFRVMKRNGDENHYENGGRNNRLSEILL